MIDLELWEKRKKELKLTFDELSSLSGIPKRTILGVFRKEVITPRIDTVQAIEKALGLGNTTSEEYAAGWRNTATVQITPDEDDILDKYRELKQILGEKKGADLVKSLLDNLIGSLQKP